MRALIGAGELGDTYDADGRAVKLLTRVDDRTIANFVRATPPIFDHPNVVRVHAWDLEDERTPRIVMDRMHGPTLDARIGAAVVAPQHAARIALQLLSALDACGIVHGDVRPANVFIVEDQVKLSDFVVYLTTIDRTRTTTGFGPWHPLPYVSPERLAGADADARGDVYAVGACLFEMLTGKRAFPEPAVIALAAAILQRVPDSVPGVLSEVVARALAKDPDERYASPREMADAIRACVRR